MRGHYSDIWQAVARAFPDRPAVVTPEEVLTYDRLVTEAGALAGHLRTQGVEPGDSVAIFSYNRPEYVVALFACFACGFAPVPMNFRYRPAELRPLLEDAEVRTLIHPRSLRDVVHEAVDGLRLPLVEIDDTGDGPVPTADLPDTTPWDKATSGEAPLPATPPAGGELRLFTGGTTGRPRAVVWDAADILDVQMYSIYGTAGLPMPATLDEAVAVAADPATPATVSLPLAPLMHGTALFTSMNTLALGGSILMLPSPRLDSEAAARFAVDAGATRIVVAGDAIALPLVEAVESLGLVPFGRVASIISSGMRLSPQVKRRVHDVGDIAITDLLASTEGGPYAVNVTRSADDLPGELRLLPGAVVLDEERNDVAHLEGGRGILGFRGTLPKGYFHDEQKTREAFPLIRGVRHVVPGDWAVARGDGTVELLGRGSAVVNTGGEKVYPAEVEQALLDHPLIVDAVVFGMPDARYGEVVTAVVATPDGEPVDDGELRAHLDARLAGYKRPRNVVFRSTLDRSPHGKVDLARLKAAVAPQIDPSIAPTGTMRVTK
ncbi:AMP-binding protein [Microbacterium marinilacus]|uniref:Acyl-CoA synthetase n=1 Tax=Microbacterium marinilacus TaxID=415209 RepID=A0ABP7BSL3_9MICO|nr:AMP-binding protein [Microbacterium marinilacus]MBY0689064.1 AMP-binding protein [Microbacterium marinilacus]